LSLTSSHHNLPPVSEHNRSADTRWWSRLSFLKRIPASCVYVTLLTLFVVLLYGINMDRLSVRGEESRRGRTAWEMIEYKDWIVPRLQGEPRLTRPPLSYWLIAATMEATGQTDAISVRLPSVLSVLVTSLALYAYVTYLLNPTSGFLAAFAFMTLGQVLQLGRLGESEAIFTALMGSALITLHLSLRPVFSRSFSPGEKVAESSRSDEGTLHSSRWTIFSLWALPLLSGSLAALAMLTKGIQSPVYYFGTMTFYLLWRAGGVNPLSLVLSAAQTSKSTSSAAILHTYLSTLQRAWRPVALMSFAFAATFAAWLIPFAMRLGPEGLYDITFEELAKHVTTVTTSEYINHLVQFPIELFLGCLLPWSLLLPAFFDKTFRTTFFNDPSPAASTRRDIALFSTIGFLIALPTVWIPTDGNTRYLMPVYPLVAVLASIITTHLLAHHQLSYLWRRFLLVLPMYIAAGIALAITMMIVSPDDRQIVFSPWNIGLLLLSPLALYILWRTRHLLTVQTLHTQILTMAGLLVLISQGPMTDFLNYKRLHANHEVAEARARIPKSEKLVSLGLIHHLFSFYYAERIPMVTLPDNPAEIPADFEYFCFHHKGADQPLPEFPFDYTIISTVNCDRKEKDRPYDLVIVAKRDAERPEDIPLLSHKNSAKWLHPAAFDDEEPGVDQLATSQDPLIH
jgi:4-amino-4-deoxy-L-arabinose transferase-like glycosyltransferase